MATVTTGYTFVNNETVTPAKLNSLAGGASVSNIQTTDIADSQITTVKIADANVTTAKIADGAVTLAKLVATVQQALLPAGAVQAFAMNSAPSGWLAADGAAISRTTYASLFNAIGTTYGTGDGSTTFTLPDLRASFVRGAGSDGVATAGTFGVKQADDFKSHTHTATVTDPGHTHTTNADNKVISGTGISNGPGFALAGTTINSSTTGITVANASTGGTETRPRNIAMLYCIKF
jgi:microcystin-dependent protein